MPLKHLPEHHINRLLSFATLTSLDLFAEPKNSPFSRTRPGDGECAVPLTSGHICVAHARKIRFRYVISPQKYISEFSCFPSHFPQRCTDSGKLQLNSLSLPFSGTLFPGNGKYVHFRGVVNHMLRYYNNTIMPIFEFTRQARPFFVVFSMTGDKIEGITHFTNVCSTCADNVVFELHVCWKHYRIFVFAILFVYTSITFSSQLANS